ncbi:hypothetical protein P43SY_002461 [Pythium insidiosum]|uniref:Deubiquitinating enzyme MINDY-3/4 conserved domain-containing protein n=1 Tax=Pythium insidiosum TaxID=114742 RepID=A0AAD5LCV4_PYTIN|nr:hypothetical protein P43SY_002461 [Pythium insidiosum]
MEETQDAITSHVDSFMEPNGNGLVQFVLSVLLSKGVENIRSEMDAVAGALSDATGGTGKLVGAHDYCTQELVNLLLCGFARSNVFDGEQRLEGDPGDVVLKGIPSRCAVGFLSLFEAYDYIQVGSFLKRPQFNVWVVCSESHYSVFFADPKLLMDESLERRQQLDVFYFDGLANQDEEIRLTLTMSESTTRNKPKFDELIPPLNLVLQTKWPRATIDWNGVEPLL